MRSILFSLAGITYGAVLSFLSFFAAGAGHGTYLLHGLSSAPVCFPIFTDDYSILLSPLIVWGTVGFVSTSHRLRLVFTIMMASHYCGVILIFLTGMFGSWHQTSRSLWG